MVNKENTTKDLSIVHNALKITKKYDLETEVVLHALYSMKENPKQTIQKVLADAMNEWIK